MRDFSREKAELRNSISVNSLAWDLLNNLTDRPALYGVEVEKTEAGTIVVDAGIAVKGGFEAGRLITEICMGGCGHAEITCREYGDVELPSISIHSDQPVIATLGSQYAGWRINEEGYFAIGSGPARALAKRPKEIYEEIDYEDHSDKAVAILETNKNPPARVIEKIVRDCNVSSEDLALILTPTTSIAGATQVSGRVVETGIHKLRKLGLDPNIILNAWGIAPIPPIHPKFTSAMARTNDAILYGGVAYYIVDYGNEKELERIVSKASSKASKDYGKLFMEILKEANYDFYKIDPIIFAPAVVIVNNRRTGHTFSSGETNAEAMAKSFGFQTMKRSS